MKEILYILGIDWKLIIAQIINFFILFFIIYKFFAQPLNEIIEKRRKEILEGYKIREDAENLMEKIKNLREEILKKAEEERLEIIKSAYQEKEQLLNQFINEIENLRKEFNEKFEIEKNEKREIFYQELMKEIPEILEKFSKKVFHNKELNREFIESILKE